MTQTVTVVTYVHTRLYYRTVRLMCKDQMASLAGKTSLEMNRMIKDQAGILPGIQTVMTAPALRHGRGLGNFECVF